MIISRCSPTQQYSKQVLYHFFGISRRTAPLAVAPFAHKCCKLPTKIILQPKNLHLILLKKNLHQKNLKFFFDISKKVRRNLPIMQSFMIISYNSDMAWSARFLMVDMHCSSSQRLLPAVAPEERKFL